MHSCNIRIINFLIHQLLIGVSMSVQRVNLIQTCTQILTSQITAMELIIYTCMLAQKALH